MTVHADKPDIPPSLVVPHSEDAEETVERSTGPRAQRRSLMRRAAELYYEQSLSQQQIARIMGSSHSTISRLLSDARAEGIVRITIARATPTDPGLSRDLRRRFDLRDAVVVSAADTPEAELRAVGTAAADLLLALATNDVTIGITWGETMHHVVRALRPVPLRGVEVIQLSGSLGHGDLATDGPRIAFHLAEALGGTCRLVPAPAMMETAEAASALLAQRQVREPIERAAEADIVVQGIGALTAEGSSLERAGYIDREQRLAAIEAGAVGHVFARMIDAEGRELPEWSARVIGVPLEALPRAGWSLCVAASSDKAPALVGALRARLFNTVVVDERTARAVLALADGR